ncbi:uncharacterized protein ppp2r5b isoform X4 [Nerophis ophidion]|uniref:uncharacterized protein ppp2r5b isoform X4 n=1 Tax=Nerophis ophidion TaxID=159077 RepID=UPI002ADF4DA4|nr:uncharacterized protein ppp2r5b isoform X4 [Nerophis ophidion]
MPLLGFLSRDTTDPHKDVDWALSEVEKKTADIFQVLSSGEKRQTSSYSLDSNNGVCIRNFSSSTGKLVGFSKTTITCLQTPTAMTHFRSDCIRDYAKACHAKCPVSLTSTKLRKHAATLLTVLNMTDTEMDQLANFLGLDIRIHREFCRLPEKTLQLAKISKVLKALEQGRLSEFHGKNLDEITTGPNECVLETEEEALTREDENYYFPDNGKAAQKKRPSTQKEELQQLERSNSDFQKEIRALKKDVHRYTTALERHKPFCRLGASALTTTSSQAPEPVDPNKSTRPSLSSALSSHSVFTPPPHSVFFRGFSTPASAEIDNLFQVELQDMAASTTLPSEPPLSAESFGAPLLDLHEFTGNSDNLHYQWSTSFAQASEDTALKPSEELMSASKLLLSLLSNPSPSGNLPTSSSNLDVPFQSNASSLAMMEECPGNLSFSDLLEDNEWILNAGTSE